FKSFESIIKETVLKEKYQNVLIEIYQKYDSEKLNATNTKEFVKTILKRIEDEKLFVHEKTGQQLTWLSTYTDKNAAVRPMGLSMDLNSDKEIKDISNPRLRRIAKYRLNYISDQIEAIKKLDLFPEEKNALIREVKDIPLYSNAIY